MKKLLILSSVAALLAGCYTNDTYDDNGRGAAYTDRGVYYYSDSSVPPVMNTNSQMWPVRSGASAAMPPGTGSGGTLRDLH